MREWIFNEFISRAWLSCGINLIWLNHLLHSLCILVQKLLILFWVWFYWSCYIAVPKIEVAKIAALKVVFLPLRLYACERELCIKYQVAFMYKLIFKKECISTNLNGNMLFWLLTSFESIQDMQKIIKTLLGSSRFNIHSCVLGHTCSDVY